MKILTRRKSKESVKQTEEERGCLCVYETGDPSLFGKREAATEREKLRRKRKVLVVTIFCKGRTAGKEEEKRKENLLATENKS